MQRKVHRRHPRGRPSGASLRYQARHKAMGLCSVCPRPLAGGSMVYCTWHLEKNRQRKRRLRGPILCRRCRKPLRESERGPGRRYHPRCSRALIGERERSPGYRRLHAEAARAYQLRHAAQGLCTQCPRPVVPGKGVCRRHLRYRQERYRRLKALGKLSGSVREAAPIGVNRQEERVRTRRS
ncbi:MAG: hypothetical protein HY713_08060 [candidate division NC10 bacterium]|nr:hypothetical protein [candidate division NC10 bacterium]